MLMEFGVAGIGDTIKSLERTFALHENFSKRQGHLERILNPGFPLSAVDAAV